MLSGGLANTDAPLVTVICSPLHRAAVFFRLSVYIRVEHYRCFGCDMKGDAISNRFRRPFRLHISFQSEQIMYILNNPFIAIVTVISVN